MADEGRVNSPPGSAFRRGPLAKIEMVDSSSVVCGGWTEKVLPTWIIGRRAAENQPAPGNISF